MKINLSIEAGSTEELQAALASLAAFREGVDELASAEQAVSNLVESFEETAAAQLDEAPEQVDEWSNPVDPDQAEPDEPRPDTPQTDSAGLPHDERIHAGSKATNKDGTWRRRKGVDVATVELIEAELRGTTEEPVTTEPEAVAPQAEEPATLPAPSETMRVLTELMRTGAKAPSYLKELSESVGIPAITAIISNADAHTAVRAKLAEEGLI